MSSRDFTHELHRTTKTLGYSKVIETLQSMAKIQPSGANDVPTTFRQHRAERDAHNTFGELSNKFFNTPDFDIHQSFAEKYYRRRVTALPTPLTAGSLFSDYTITPDGFTPHQDRFNDPPAYRVTQGTQHVATNDGQSNLTVATVFELNVYDLVNNPSSITNSPQRIVNTRVMSLHKHGSTLFYIANSGFPVHVYRDFQNNSKIHIVVTAEYNTAGTLVSAVYWNGERLQVSGAQRIAPWAATGAVLQPFIEIRGSGVTANPQIAISHVSQFTHWDAANFDMDAWITKDRAGDRDFTDPDITEWFSWRGYSLALERDELPAAYTG